MKRGSNQSSRTKYATSFVCDAISLIESGRVGDARRLLCVAVSMLPEINNETQVESEKEYRQEWMRANRG